MPDGEKSPLIGARTGRFSSMRVRLLAIALLPMLVVMPLFLGAVVLNWSARFDSLLIAKVNGELTIAHQYLTRILQSNKDHVRALGKSAEFEKTVLAGDDIALAEFLSRTRLTLGLDFLYYIRENGQLVATTALNDQEDLTKWPVVQQALDGEDSTEIDIFSAEDLAGFSPELAAQARIELVKTEAAVPTLKTAETRGMVIHTAAAVQIGGDQAALVGGVLLNRNLGFIDTINDLVYPAASLTEGSRGTATLFLDDVRVSTNVRLFENVRALGTRVSGIVRASVLERGEVWLDRAFVVNDWYISAYEPVIDSFGNRVGMLYVGFLDTPFQAAKLRTFVTILVGFLVILALSLPIFLRWTRGILKPLECMIGTISRVESGDLGARSNVTTGQGEITLVAGHLDGLLEQLQERDRDLRRWGEDLNARVEARTQELREANQRLEATTKQLVVSEKLAAIGEITAGIAHEINNPIAVIQGNLDVIEQEIDVKSSDLETEFALIHEQVHSVNILVNKLLQFARPEEYAGFVDHHLPDEVINDSIPLVQHLLNKVDIVLSLDLHADRAVSLNRTELQQVLINLMVNAIHAMPNGGQLFVRTYNHDEDAIKGVLIEVADTGQGMPKEVLDCVFDPFFTTKLSEGTGLGLSISRKLLTRGGGYIKARSEVGVGTTFSIWLPSADIE
ncbi:MAG: cache domain-containing protein [Rhodobacterales bacterium]|nr:cache domain-containing protein [Rhodobacterales bacterium]